MKKKIIIIGIVILLIIVGIVTFAIVRANTQKDENTKNENEEPKNLIEAVLKKNNKTKEEVNYQKFVDGEVLNENSKFTEYAFTSNNSIYIFDPAKLKQGIHSYKKVYDVPSNIQIKTLTTTAGNDIDFVDTTDTTYRLFDQNTNTRGKSYENHEKAIYEFRKFSIDSFTEDYFGRKIDYDVISIYWYAKDNILYRLGYKDYDIATRTTIPAEVKKIEGNYLGEKIINIYNERILKTDKGFYEIVDYTDDTTKMRTTATMKIKLLTEYYDEVLTCTYEYVVLKDYTLIPINDVMSRPEKYQYSYYGKGLNNAPQSFEE